MSKARVLIVEDQLIVAEDLAKLMEESGHEVIGICETGEEAVNTCLLASADLVIVDIQLRGAMDGIQAVQQIRTQQDPAIVYLTAHSEKGLFERAKQTEPDGYLYKPVSPLELTRTVEIVLFKKKMETRLRESEEKYRELVETISDGIVQTDTVGTVTFANPAYCRMLGFTMEEIIGKSILDFQVSESERKELSSYLEYIGSRQPHPVPWFGTHQTKDGGLIVVQCDWNYRRGRQGHITGFIAVVKDITEGRRAEDALRKSEEEFRRIIENLQDPFYRADMNGIFTFLSPASERVAGYKPEEGVGHPITMFYADPTERQEFMKLITENGFVNDFQARLVHKDGHTVWVSTSARLFKDEEGKIAGVEGIARDITDRKRAEEALRDSEEKYRLLFSHEKDAILLSDAETKTILDVNRSCEKLWGYGREEFLSMRVPSLSAEPENTEKALAAVTSLGGYEVASRTLKRKDGTDFIAEISANPFTLKGRLVVCSIVRDITDRKRTEEEAEIEKLRFESLAENSPFGLIMIHEDGTFHYVNPKFREMFGYELKDVPNGKEWLHKAYPDPAYRRQVISAWLEDLSNSSIGEHRPRVFTVACKDGRKKIVHFRPVQLQTGEHLMTSEDISERWQAEEKLRQSEEKYRQLVEHLNVGVFESTVDGAFTHINPAIVKMSGYGGPEELMATPAHRLYADVSDRKKLISALMDKGSVNCMEMRSLKKDGTEYWISITAVLAKGDKGEPDRITGIVEDITDRKNAAVALSESENRLRRLIDHSPMAIAVSDMNGEVKYLNKRFIQTFGCMLEDIPTLEHWWQLAYPDQPHRESVRSEWLHATRESAEKGTEPEPVEREVRCKDGTIRVIDFRKTLVDKLVIHTLRDVTENRRQEEALRESEQMFRLLSEQSLMSVAILQDGIYKYANQAMSDLCEYSLDEILSWGYEEFLQLAHPDDRFLVMKQARMKQQGDSAQQANYMFRVVTKSGKTKWVEIYSKTIQYNKRGANLLTMIDITGRKQAEEQLLQSQKMEAIGTLAGGVAHEINNLLQVVLGHADMVLIRGGIDEKSSQSLEAIRRAARNGGDLVNRILAFSRKTEPQKIPLNLSHEVRRVEELLRRTIPRMISFEMSLEDDLRVVNADPSQIEQILLNLAVNARDAMQEGGRLVFETRNVTIREEYCRTHPEVDPGKYVLLSVSDTGHGMAKGIMDRIFEPFFTTKQPGKGTGLGLSMVFGLVKSHGGHITCYSEGGVGSTFKLYFPAFADDVRPDLATTIEMPAGGTEKLLLVDDEDSVRTLGSEMLELAGYTVLTATNGREALEVYRNNLDSIALVILDLIMPEMSGRKCLEELLKINPNAKVLIASGYAANGPAKEARESGAVGFVTKPFDLKHILLAIRKCLDSVR